VSLIMVKARTAQQAGCPVISRKLKLPFLRWAGKHDMSNADAIIAAGIPRQHGLDWLGSDLRILREAAQKILLEHAGVQECWRELEKRGVVL